MLPLARTHLVCSEMFVVIVYILAFRIKCVLVRKRPHYKNLIITSKLCYSPKCVIVPDIFGRPTELSIVLNTPLERFSASETLCVLCSVVVAYLLDVDARHALSMFRLKIKTPIIPSNSSFICLWFLNALP